MSFCPVFLQFTLSEHEMKLITASACGFMIDETELKRDRKVRPFSMFEPTELPATSLRKNQSSDDLVRDAQVKQNALLKSLQGQKKISLQICLFPTGILPAFNLLFLSSHLSRLLPKVQ